jgi:hypothetical protein
VYARSTTILAHPESIDAGVAHIRDEVMPTLLGMDGCIGLSMLADPNTGRCIAASAWQTREAMLAGERQLRPVRDHAAEILGGRPQVDEWEIAVLHRDHTSGPGACVPRLVGADGARAGRPRRRRLPDGAAPGDAGL